MKEEKQQEFISEREEKSLDNQKDWLRKMEGVIGAKKEVIKQMPKYKCIKEVWALKIKSIVFDSDLAREAGRTTDGTAIITPEGCSYAPIKLDASYVDKHKPEAGGYYVIYKDGYKSFSPAKAFEEGYELIS